MKNWDKYLTGVSAASIMALACTGSRAYAVTVKIGPGFAFAGPSVAIHPIALLRLDTAPSPLAVSQPWAFQAGPVGSIQIRAALPAPAAVAQPQETAFRSLQAAVMAQAQLGQDRALAGGSDSLSQKAGIIFDGTGKASSLTADPVPGSELGKRPAVVLIRAAKVEKSSFKSAPPLRNRGYLDTKLANALSVAGVVALAAGAAISWVPAPVLTVAAATIVLGMFAAFMAGGLAEMIAEAAKASEKTREAAVAWSVLAGMLAVVVPVIALSL